MSYYLRKRSIFARKLKIIKYLAMIRELLFVGAGGFLGSVTRYGISILVKNMSTGFPWGTLIANLLGCFLIGLLYGLGNRHAVLSANTMLFLTVGFCGGFTTFSTFSKEGLLLMQAGNWGVFFLYVFGSVFLGLLAVAGGLWAGK